MHINLQTPTLDCNSRHPQPYSIDPAVDVYTAGLLFNQLEAEYQAARARAGVVR